MPALEKLRSFKVFLNKKILRFLFVGGLNTLFGYSVFALVIYFSDGNLEAGLIAMIVAGIFFNYLSYGFVVFKNMGGWQFVKFIAAYLVLYMVNRAALGILLQYQVNLYLGQLINILYLMPISYLVFNKVVFLRAKSKNSSF